MLRNFLFLLLIGLIVGQCIDEEQGEFESTDEIGAMLGGLLPDFEEVYRWKQIGIDGLLQNCKF